MKSWEEGNLLIFLDAYEHEAFNYSNERRYVLQLDVLRPEFRSNKYKICSRVLGATTIYGFTYAIPGLRKRFEDFPNYIKGIFVFFAQLYFLMWLFLQRNIFSIELM